MNIYLISQNVNNDYDTYDSAVVVAQNENDAQAICPGGEQNRIYGWAPIEKVKVMLIGKARLDWTNPSIVCSSFNAG